MSAAAPFFKAAGGKRQLLTELRKSLPRSFGCYYEPFVGGGALYFDLAPEGVSVLNDANPHMMAAYRAVRNNCSDLIVALREHATAYASGGESYFYEIRARAVDPTMLVEAAARFLFLNRTCFNGLYRVNRAGMFNVPHGRYHNPTICDESALRAAAQPLAGAVLTNTDFENAVAGVKMGDLVYFDPPYIPVSDTSNFTGYTRDGFTLTDQERLRDLALRLKRTGVNVVLSNADVPIVRNLYKNFDVRSVQVRRNINSNAGKRGPVGEVIIT